MHRLIQGDCLDVMDKLIQEGIKVDTVITDPPYGTTACAWDSVIPFEPMWQRLKALRKDRTPIVLFGSEPFSSLLRVSNLKEFKYDWVWDKKMFANQNLAKIQPLKIHELVHLFYMHDYKPQDLIRINKITKQGLKVSDNNGGGTRKTEYFQEHTNYPKSIIKFRKEHLSLHPTQKPVKLLEYLIKTYTNKGDTVLDFTMGSGTTGVAAIMLDRDFIGIEREEKYCNIAQDRINNATRQTTLFD